MEELPLPPGFDSHKLQQAMRALVAALGEDRVFAETLDREAYHDKFAIDDSHNLPLAAVADDSVEEVQAVV